MARDLHRPLREAWIVDAVRTPIGRYGGALATVRPDDLAALVIRAIVDRTGIDPALVEDVILGCANQAGEDNRNVARMAALLAGLPVEVGGPDRQPAVRLGAPGGQRRGPRDRRGRRRRVHRRRRRVHDARAVRDAQARGRLRARAARRMEDTTLGWRFVNPRHAGRHYPPISLGETAENVAEQWTRRPRAPGRVRAREPAPGRRGDRGRAVRRPARAGRVAGRKGAVTVVDRDEHPRADTSAEALAGLKPAFQARRHRHRRQQLRDQRRRGGAAARRGRAGARARAAAAGAGRRDGRRRRPPGRDGHRPGARRRARRSARAGLDGRRTSTSSSSTRRSRSQSVACMDELGLDPARVNPNGGAIALGHPLGASRRAAR